MASTSRKDSLDAEQMETEDEMLDEVEVGIKELVPPSKDSGRSEMDKTFVFRESS